MCVCVCVWACGRVCARVCVGAWLLCYIRVCQTLNSVQQLVDIEPSPVSAMRMTLAQVVTVLASIPISISDQEPPLKNVCLVNADSLLYEHAPINRRYGVQIVKGKSKQNLTKLLYLWLKMWCKKCTWDPSNLFRGTRWAAKSQQNCNKASSKTQWHTQSDVRFNLAKQVDSLPPVLDAPLIIDGVLLRIKDMNVHF